MVEYTPKVRYPEVPCYVTKADVGEVILFHATQGGFKTETYLVFKEIMDSFPDPFLYNNFMSACQHKSYTRKMVRDEKERFYNSFKERMRKFKKGKDWKKI
jgi:hypothetical protein